METRHTHQFIDKTFSKWFDFDAATPQVTALILIYEIFPGRFLLMFSLLIADHKGGVRAEINNTDSEFSLTKFYYKTSEERKCFNNQDYRMVILMDNLQLYP